MTSPNITIVTKENFEAEVMKADKLVLIDFTAAWCGPCQALAPTLDKFADDNKATVKVVKIDIDNSPELAQAFGVQSIPTLVTMKDGQGLLGAVGNLPASALKQLVDQSLATPSAELPGQEGPGPNGTPAPRKTRRRQPPKA